ncbi:protein MRP-126-like [Heteronotia binoei]|uniref:protein MRP-126-like n=1 Tax=Heteronotia binoei TaxID=13085 RepID=UPI0029302D11|nr:protein MRP-126-like [Heteronotia binoei]XP_060116892.1 protein MRP-126-like [Heteronotia binoei]
MPLTEMEQSVQTILKLFHESAAQEGDFDTLSKAELKGFITKNFPTFMKKLKDPSMLDNVFEQLDTNKDQEISFGEVMQFVTIVAILSHDRLHGGSESSAQ